jgi:hypothetical protein
MSEGRICLDHGFVEYGDKEVNDGELKNNTINKSFFFLSPTVNKTKPYKEI